MLDLQSLARLPAQPLVVRDLEHRSRDARAERRLELRVRGARVLDGVMEQGRGKDFRIADAALQGQHGREGDRMIDVGRRRAVLASLIAMLVRGEGERPKKQRQVVFHA